MPREIVTIQVGQCGNQIGLAFWDLLLKEHLLGTEPALFNESFSSFFKNLDHKQKLLPLYDVSKTNQERPNLRKIRNLRARAVIVDTEEGVVNQIKKSKLGSIFSAKQVRN